MSVENVYSHEPQPPVLRVIDGGLADDGSDEAPTILVDDVWYTESQWLRVLGVGQGYVRYADRRPVDVSWLLLGGRNHVETTGDAQRLLEEHYDLERYRQPELQEYLGSEAHAATKLHLKVPEGA